MTMEAHRERRLGTRLVRHSISFVALAALTLPLVTTAGAEGEPPPDFDKFLAYKEGHIWDSRVEARGYAPFVRIPYGVMTGSPYSRSDVGSQPGRCFTYAAPVYGDEIVDEFVSNGTPGNDDPKKGPLTPLARAENPSTAKNPTKSDLNADPPGGSRTMVPGPMSALADCSAGMLQGSSWASYSKVGDAANGVESAGSSTSASLDTANEMLHGEALTNLEHIAVGGLRIDRFASWMKVEMKPNSEPVVSYRLSLIGVRQGEQRVAGSESDGVVLAGNSVAGGDLAKQFNTQMAANEKALQALATYHITIMAPSVKFDGSAYLVRAPIADIDIDGSKAKDAVTSLHPSLHVIRGESYGLRLGQTSFSGVHTGKGA